eukprot:scaffold36113_cov13-Prasinocladus_malaysianus.AAC.1
MELRAFASSTSMAALWSHGSCLQATHALSPSTLRDAVHLSPSASPVKSCDASSHLAAPH